MERECCFEEPRRLITCTKRCYSERAGRGGERGDSDGPPIRRRAATWPGGRRSAPCVCQCRPVRREIRRTAAGRTDRTRSPAPSDCLVYLGAALCTPSVGIIDRHAVRRRPPSSLSSPPSLSLSRSGRRVARYLCGFDCAQGLRDVFPFSDDVGRLPTVAVSRAAVLSLAPLLRTVDRRRGHSFLVRGGDRAQAIVGAYVAESVESDAARPVCVSGPALAGRLAGRVVARKNGRLIAAGCW